MPRVLHLLSQRPSLTGSGVTLEAMVRHGKAAEWEQRVVVAVPAGDPDPEIGGLAAKEILPLTFEAGALDFPIPGMSDVMPYRSTRFAAMTAEQLDRYRAAWRDHLGAVLGRFQPDLVHAHHIWLLGAWIKDLAPGVPVVSHCHATGLRQMRLCPELAGEVRRGCARNDRFLVLHAAQADELAVELAVDRDRIRVVGGGYREDLFHSGPANPGRRGRLVFIGKYSAAKGLPWLLDAFQELRTTRPELELHVVGDGTGTEAEALRRRMQRLQPTVVLHGLLRQEDLAELLRDCEVCILPSFYEGLPLVLVEAAACGCRLVATRLPGTEGQLAATLDPVLELVSLPRLTAIDTPDPDDLPAFVEALAAAIDRSLGSPRDDPGQGLPPGALEPFTWNAVGRRVEAVWRELLG